MKVVYNITQNKFNAILNQETTEIKVKFQTGYYPLPGGGGGDLSNYYKKDETYSKIEIDNLLDAIEVTKTELDVLISENKLKPNRLYKITGVESWSFSQHLIKAIYLKATSNNTLETNGFGEFYNVEYGSNQVWAGNLLEAGLIDSLEYAVDDLVIWGNLLWTNISGEVGTNLKNFGEDFGDISLPNYLSDSDWLPLTPQESSYNYNISIDVIKYDIDNNYISYREDTLGNKYEQSFDNLVRNYPNYEIADSDASYMYYVGGISLFHWGEPDTVYGNTIKDSLVLNCNNSSQSLLESSFYNNTFENSLFYNNLIISSYIRNNKFLDSYIQGNYLKGSDIVSNEYVKSNFTLNRFDTVVFVNNKLLSQSNFGSNIFKDISVGFNTLNSSYIVNNNLKSTNQSSNVRLYKNTLYDSSIQSNMYYIDITFNTLSRDSTIAGNIDNEITVYNRISTISKNNLDNNSTINSNNFVEEGTGISVYSKGINDNILNNTCNINSNIVKNGSRIYGHTLEYYSTINNNSLDTDANIYNNQVIQNGKIDNNILTGHGRIYGNQLDRKSEITLCKLRISPATSYATEMKNNKLFAGKIQNIDFGDIVNPVGTNPNDPTFGGNALSECIIENNSIIKDLTFPNTGNKHLNFVRLSGFSELKNITVSSVISGVEFINTVFDENSDFSKLIASDAYLGNGYTRFYIDNKLVTLSKLTDGIRLDDTIQNTNPFGGRKLYINTIDNVLAGANKKYWVTVTKHKKIYNSVNYPKPINAGDITLPQWEDSPIIATYDGAQLFNNNYENYITCESDEYLKVALDFSADKTAYFNGFPYGTYYLSYYYDSTPDKAEVRCYNGFPTHTVGYKTGIFTDFINTNNSGGYVQQYTDNSNNQRRNIEFIIYGHPSHPTSLTQIEWKLQRPEFNKHSSFVSNFTTNKLFQILKLGDQTTDKIILNPNGTITADSFKTPTGTPNQALTANGGTFNLDSKENVANKATDLLSPDNTKYPTTLAVVNETKKATITVELISQLTTNFYAPNALRINSTALISGSGTLTLKVNDVAYTLTDLIPQGAKITAETTSSSVYNLISIYE